MLDKIWLRGRVTNVLIRMGMYSEGATELLMGTCAQESTFGKYKTQLGGGPAKGYWQIEPLTMNDNWHSYINFRPKLKELLEKEFGMTGPDLWRLENDVDYGIVMARLKYRRSPARIPEPDDIEGLAHVWKEVYNTPLGAGTEEEFEHNYKKYCA